MGTPRISDYEETMFRIADKIHDLHEFIMESKHEPQIGRPCHAYLSLGITQLAGLTEKADNLAEAHFERIGKDLKDRIVH